MHPMGHRRNIDQPFVFIKIYYYLIKIFFLSRYLRATCTPAARPCRETGCGHTRGSVQNILLCGKVIIINIYIFFFTILLYRIVRRAHMLLFVGGIYTFDYALDKPKR